LTAGRWPNLFLVGAAKAGTSSLYAHLARHPEVYMAPMKEPHYFSRIHPDPRLAPFFPYIDDEESYLRLFADATSERFLGEASTSYFWDETSAWAIKRASPEAKIIVMLREPVARAYSHYWNDVREGFERRSFRQAINEELEDGTRERGWGVSSLYVECGLYAEQVLRYVRAFPESVALLFFEDFVADTHGELTRVLAFLEIDTQAAFVEGGARNPFALPRGALSAKVIGSGRVRSIVRRVVPRTMRAYARSLLLVQTPKPPVDPDVAALLHEVFRPDVRALQALLDRKVPWPEYGEGD